jgi:uncharacterized protein YcbK (DUF882 family)
MRLSVLAGCAAVFVSSIVGADPRVSHGQGMAEKKARLVEEGEAPLLGTLVQTHTHEHDLLDASSPTPDRFSSLLADRSTGQRTLLDPRLLGLLRSLAVAHPAARIELVSGYRSAKLNEMLRKKGHHVASHSQHSLGHATDFRIVEQGSVRGLDPHDTEREIRALGWTGGVGPYENEGDWFVHADVGPQRRWEGQ